MIKLEINERVSYLRKNILKDKNGKKYSQVDFGNILGLSRDVIGNIEYNRVEVKEHMLKLICQTFNVNEDWLRNGIEPIFKEGNKENDLVEELKNKYQLNDTYTSLIKSLIALDEETQNKVVGLFFKCVEDYYKNNPSALDKLNEKCNTDANTKIIPISKEEDELSIVVGLFFKCVEDYYKNNPSALDKLNEKCNTDANTKIIPISKEEDELSITEDLDDVRLYDFYKNNPSALDKLNEKCNTDANTKIIPISKEEDELSITEDLDDVRLYDLPVSAGTGTYLLDDVSYEVITIDRRHYKDVDFALRVSGDSMEPRFFNGDIIYVKSTLQVNNGEIGVFYYNDEAYLKKLEHKNGKIFLISLNEKYEPIEITNDSFKVVGIVL